MSRSIGIVVMSLALTARAGADTVAPKASLELAWDLNRGDIEDEGTAFVHTVTLGLRLRF